MTPTALSAIDLIVRTIGAFQNQLAPLNEACDVMIDGILRVKAGTLDEEYVQRMISAKAMLAGLSSAVAGLSVIEPACDIVAREIETEN